MLVDAGVDTTLAVRLTNTEGELVFHGMPVALVSRMLREKTIAGKDATEEHLHKLKGIRRLLLRLRQLMRSLFCDLLTCPSLSVLQRVQTGRLDGDLDPAEEDVVANL